MRPVAATILILLFALAPATAAADAPARDPWVALEPGLELGLFTSPKIADGAVRVLRIDPARFALELHSAAATERNIALSTREWCEAEGLVAAITPSMFGKDLRSSISLMKTVGYVNNPRLSRDNSVLMFDARTDSLPPVRIVDRTCEDYEAIAPSYASQVQSIRMVSCEGRCTWHKRNKPFSAALIGMDHAGRLLFIFCHRKTEMPTLVAALLALPLNLARLQYGEGGSSAQMCVAHPAGGYYGCGLFERDAAEGGDDAPAVPNVIGIIKKSPH